VTIDANSIVSSLLVSGTLQFEVANPRSVNVLTQVSINSGGIFRSAQSGNVKNHQLIIQGSIINDGIIDFSSNSNATGVEIIFRGSGNAIFNCSDAPLTNLRQTNGIILDKGTSAASVLSFIPGKTFRILSDGSARAKGFLSIINGTFNIIGSNEFINPVFDTDGNYTIPATGGFWLGNQNATVIGMDGTATNLGDLKITNGTYQVGISGENSLENLNDGQLKMLGGVMNVGKLNIDGGICTIAGGEINLVTKPKSGVNEPSFHVSGQAKLEIYGNPVITIAYPNSKDVLVNDIQIQPGSGSKSITGGKIQLGTAVTPAQSNFLVSGEQILSHLTVFSECNINVFNTSRADLSNTSVSLLPKIAFDKIAPILTAPQKITIKCGDNLPKLYSSLQEFITAGGTASDNCTLLPSSFKLVGQIQSSTNCPYTITRTYEISDVSGNVGTAEHQIVVEGESIALQPEVIAESTVKEELKLKSAMAGATITSTTTGGDWNVGSSWSGGVVPTAGDNVVIVPGATITIAAAASCDNITIDAGGTLNYSGTNTLTVTGDWTNNGTYNAGTNGTVEFAGNAPATISGSAASNFYNFTLNKGSGISDIVSVANNIAISNLTFANGVLKMNTGTTSISDITNLYNTIPKTAGLVVSGGTLNTGNFSIENEGLIQVISGAANFGTNSGNSVHTQIDGAFIVSGGIVGIAGRLENTASGTLAPGVPSGISISNGTITLAKVGNGLSSVGSLNVTSAGTFDFNGGTIVFQNESAATTAIDLGLIGGSGAKTTIGGTFQFGNASTPAGTVFNISSEILLNSVTSSANADLKLINDITIGSWTLNPSTTIDLNGNALRLVASSIKTYTFPIDNGSGVQIPVTIDLTSGTFGANPYIEIETFGSKYSENKSSANFLNRYWTVTTSGITNPVYDVTATYVDADVSGTDSKIAMGSYGGSLPWVKYGNANAGANTLSATGITASNFTFTGITSDPPTVVIDNGAAVSICSGSSVTLTTTVTGDPIISYSWNPITNLDLTDVTKPIAAPTTNTTYTVTVTDGNGFTATDDVIITVNPIPTVTNASLTQTICSGGSTSLVTLTSGVAGTTFAWTATATAGVSGFASSGTSTIPVQTISTTGTTQGIVTYSIIPTAAGCSGTTALYTVEVNPLPIATASPTSQAICSGGTTGIALTSNLSGTTFAWTVAQTGVSGAVNGSGNVIAQSLTTTGTTSGTATYTITPTLNGCSGNSISVVITISPQPVATASPMSQILCSSGTTNIALSSSASGTTYSWTVVQSGVTGASSGTGNTINQVLSTTGSSAGTVTYSITPSANGCSGSSITAIVTVNPQPIATATPASQTICSSGTTGITLTSNLPGTSYSWAASQSGVTGAVSGSGSVISQVLSTTGVASGTATYVITPTANGCAGNTITVVVTVSPPPSITLGTIAATCPGSASFSLPYSSTTGNPNTYSISAGVPAVTGFTPVVNATLSGSPLSISLPANVPAGTYQFIISVKNASGCVSTNQTFTVDFVDIIPPVISGCPANITVSTGVGSTTCDKSATWTQPTATDNCIPAAGLTWTKNYLPGAIFPVGTTTVTYTVKDLANNTATCSFTVTVNDNTPPTFTPPGAITVYTNASCVADTTSASTGIPTSLFDNCTSVGSLIVSHTNGVKTVGACIGSYSFTRTWKVKDAAGNFVTGTQLITVADNTKPTFTFIPPVNAISCTDSQLPTFTGQPIATDNCGGSVSITYSDVTVAGSCPQNSIVTRTFKATDCSGNFSTATQTIVVTDNLAPSITMPSPVPVAACPSSIPLSYTTIAEFISAGGTASDNCATTANISIVLWDEVANGLNGKPGYCPSSIDRTYRFTDQCGNFVDKTQHIIVSAECGCAMCAGATFNLADFLGQPSGVMVFPNLQRNGSCCSNPPGNNCVSFNVRLDDDAVGVEILIDGATPSPHDWRIDCTDYTMNGNVVCIPGGAFHLFTFCKPGNNKNTYTFRSIPGVVAADGISTRVECNGQITASGIVSGAVWTSISPGVAGAYNKYLYATPTSLPGSGVNTASPTFIADASAPPVIQYKICGNIGSSICNALGVDCDIITVNVKQKIALNLNVDPTLTCVNNPLTLVADISPASTYTYEWHTGRSGTASPILSSTKTLTLTPPVPLGWYWLRVTDVDANGILCSVQDFEFEAKADFTGPSVVIPPSGNLSIECNAPNANTLIQNWLTSATAKDENGNPLPVTNTYTGITQACGTDLPVTFSASDHCGNTSSVTAHILVSDTQSPTWSTAAGALDRTIDCSDAAGLAAAQILAPVATDLCDPSLVLTKSSGTLVAGACQGTGTYVNTWTATDDCNNVSGTFTQTITVTDNQAPVITTQAQNQTVECDGSGNTTELNTWLSNHGGAVASDACGGTIIWAYDNTPFSDLCGNTGVKTVIFTATDACGNSSTTTATFTILDTTAPTLQNIPANVSFECSDCVQSFLNGGFEENTSVNGWAYIDAASVNGWETTSPSNKIEIQESGKVDGVVSYKGKYHAELNGDQVGDFYQEFCTIPTTYVQISFAHHKRMWSGNTTDDIMGVYSGPSLSNLTLLGSFTATSSSGWRLHTVAFPVPAGQTSTFFVFRAIQGAPTNNTYGNLIDDITVVTLTSPSAIPTATDNCGNANISIDEQKIDGACANNYQLIRTWTATDDCGNSASASQTVTVGDFKPPQWLSVAGSLDRTVSCSDAALLTQAQALVPLAEDNCDSSPTIVKTSGVFTPTTCIHSGTYTNTWIATDDCSNSSGTFTQVITVVDNVPPVITCPADVTGVTDTNECFSRTVVLGMATATDNCSTGAQVPITNNAPAQFPAGVTTVTWTATDACGNVATCTQLVTILDNNQPPTITCPGSYEEVIAADQCSKTGVSPGVPTIWDNCPNPALTYTLTGATTGSGIGTVSNTTFNVGVTTVTYTVTDAGGSTASCSFSVWIKRLNIPPASIACPGNPSSVNVTSGCDALVTVNPPVITDVCQTATYTITNDYTGTATATATYPVGTTTVTWTIRDNSGNVTTCVQTVTVIDNLDPVITACPVSVSEDIAPDQCTKSNVTIAPLNYTDNCSSTLTYTIVDAVGGTTSGTGIISSTYSYGVGANLITYVVTDASGNSATCTFTVTIRRLDIPPASIACPGNPSSVNVISGCDALVTVNPPVITDVCQTATYTITNDYTGTATATANYPVGTTTVTWTIRDNSGSVTTCVQTVTVIDNLDPVITACPASVSEDIAPDQCTKSDVTIDPLIYTDNCSSTLTYTIVDAVGGTTSGTGIISSTYSYGVGANLITYVVTDASGNSTTCTFTVTIRRLDIPPASIACPGNPSPVNIISGCDALVTVNPPVITDVCQTATFTITNDYTGTATATANYPVGTTTVTWTIRDNSGGVTTCVQTVTVIDNITPLFTSCPTSFSKPADFEKLYATIVDIPTRPGFIADNCTTTLTWSIVHETNGTVSSSVTTGINYVPTPYPQLDLGVNTIDYVLSDDSGNTSTCTFTVTITAKPVIDCPADIVTNTTVSDCTSSLNPGFPELISGTQTITWTWTITNPSGNIQDSGTFIGSDAVPGPPDIGDIVFQEGTSTITWTSTNLAGTTSCTHTVTVEDKEPPTFTPVSITECVDMLVSAVYSASSPNPNSGIDPNLIISPSPDYYTFKAGDESLDLTVLDDNCCGTNSLTIDWHIDFTNVPDPFNPSGPVLVHPSISGTGQPSTYIDPVSGLAADIFLWGDGVNYATITHFITYKVTDCHGNIADEQTKPIIITPRPEIIKMN